MPLYITIADRENLRATKLRGRANAVRPWRRTPRLEVIGPRPGDTVVEYTGGSTGTSLALVCAAKGHRLRIVTSEAFSREKLSHMRALGAELFLVPSEGGLTTKKLILDMIETARELSREPHTYWTDQLNNRDTIAGHLPQGEEIWDQTGGEVDAFVHCAGTAASSRGVGTALKQRAGGGALRGNVLRSERRRGDPGGGEAGAGRDGRHPDG